jgi:acyl-CoA:acyl-CoA alkyltransferase
VAGRALQLDLWRAHRSQRPYPVRPTIETTPPRSCAHSAQKQAPHRLRFKSVHLEAFGHALPAEATTSEQIEAELADVYADLGLSIGRLELMSGIRERRFWPTGTLPSEVARRAAEDALARCEIDRDRIGMLIHASVCRDFLEPASASVVHNALGLSAHCCAFDLSNACLGFANALSVVARAIEAGDIEAALVVAGEDGGPLVRQTLRHLRQQTKVTRKELKLAYASLTIGSGAAACVVTRADLSRVSRRLVGGVSLAATNHVELCRGQASGEDGPLMQTDSEKLLHAGNQLAERTWAEFQRELGWSADSNLGVITHQVGAAHRKLLLETLGLDREADFPTVEWLGNIGSVSLPITFDLADREGFFSPGQRVALLGIGSGLHCVMLGVEI